MSAATTIAPVLNPTHPASRQIAEPVQFEAQHMQALAQANRVRLARAELKRQIGAGHRNVTEVVLTCPWEAESMRVSELLCAQRRWGKARTRKLINSVDNGISENKQLGTLTERQRGLLAGALEAKATA